MSTPEGFLQSNVCKGLIATLCIAVFICLLEYLSPGTVTDYFAGDVGYLTPALKRQLEK